MAKINLKRVHLAVISLLIITVLAGSFLGVTGVRTMVGLFLLFIGPAYTILKRLKLEIEEIILFSFFLGTIFFPLAVWYINRVIPSLRVSLLTISLAWILAVGIFIAKKER